MTRTGSDSGGKLMAAILDWDLTSADERRYDEPGGFPAELEEAIEKLHERGYATTFNTVRDPVEFYDVVKERLDKVVSEGMLVGCENGARVGRFVRDASGRVDFETVAAEPLSDEDIEDVVEVLSRGHGLMAKFYSGSFARGQMAWTGAGASKDELMAKFPLLSEHLACGPDELRSILFELRPAEISVYGRADIPDRLTTAEKKPDKCKIYAKGVSKRRGLDIMADALGIDRSRSIVAGDSGPDKPMLETSDVGTRVVVGDRDLGLEDGFIRVSDPRELGLFLRSLAEKE